MNPNTQDHARLTMQMTRTRSMLCYTVLNITPKRHLQTQWYEG